MGSMTKEEKRFFKSKVPFHEGIIDKMKEYDGQDLKGKLKMSKDRNNLIDLLRNMLSYNY